MRNLAIKLGLSVFLALLVGCAEANSYVAFSLNEARKAVGSGNPGKTIRLTGGITRPIGIVYDGATQDLILVGEVDSQARPIDLDFWPIVLRAMAAGSPPAVSIDRNRETDQTGMQDVRFEGGVGDTSVGRDLLAADVVLKKLGLGLLAANDKAITPYADALAASWLHEGGEAGSLNIMWFFPSERSVVASRSDAGVALIDLFEVEIQAKLLSRGDGSPDGSSSDPVAEQFARDMTLSMPELSKQFPEIARLDSIFRLSGIAKAVVAWKEAGIALPKLDYWLEDYPVAAVTTPHRHPVLSSRAWVHDSDRTRFSVDGGIKADLLLRDWQAGSDSAFKALVILSRPKTTAVVWQVPLDAAPDRKLVDRLIASPLAKTIAHPIWGGEGTSFRAKVEGPGTGARGASLPAMPPSLGTYSKGVTVLPSAVRYPTNGVSSLRDLRVRSDSPHFKQDVNHALSLSRGVSTSRSDLSERMARTIVYGQGSGIAQALREHGGTDGVIRQGSRPSAFETTSFQHRLAEGVGSEVGSIHYSPVGRVIEIQGPKKPEIPSPMKKRLNDNPRPLDQPSQRGSGSVGSRRDDYPPGGDGLRRQMRDAVERSMAGPHGFNSGVGGVMLRGEARAVDDESELTAGDFSLVFDGSGVIGITGLRRFVTALWATYLNDVGPGISIDPISNDFSGPHAVRYIGNVINSDLGRVMREADYLMKSWSVGTSKPDVPKWRTPEDFAREHGVVHLASSRFWFVPQELVFRRTGNALMFEDGRMTLKTEYLFDQEEKASADQAGGKHHARQAASPENEEWAAMFTARYAELAAKHPVLAELCEYAQYVSLAKYLKQQKVPMLWFLLANRELALTEDSPGTVESFARQSKAFAGLEVRGGVNLQPAGGFVWDETLRATVAKAAESSNQAGKPAHDPQIPRVIDDETQAPPLPEVPAQTVVIAESNDGEGFATDIGIRKGPDPILELARFRRNDLPLVQTFGRDWHLLIPFSLRPGSNKRIEYGGIEVPDVMVLRNLVSGREEEMRFDPDRYKIAGYVPADAAASVNIGLFFLTDGALRLADKLGCEYEFDRVGRLTQMSLTPQFRATFTYAEKPLGWQDYSILPFRFQPSGEERVTFRNANLPKRLQLFDADAGSAEQFTFIADGPKNLVGYLPESPEHSAWWFAALKTDGTLTLTHRSGRTIAFDAAGQFLGETLSVVESVKSASHQVIFEYDMIADQYRIKSATVSNLETGLPAYRLDYAYDDRGSIQECAVAAVASE